jgi:hypothetical protein
MEVTMESDVNTDVLQGNGVVAAGEHGGLCHGGARSMYPVLLEAVAVTNFFLLN